MYRSSLKSLTILMRSDLRFVCFNEFQQGDGNTAQRMGKVSYVLSSLSAFKNMHRVPEIVKLLPLVNCPSMIVASQNYESLAIFEMFTK
jgi:hypothetical protein